jgi:hypothetical protein
LLERLRAGADALLPLAQPATAPFATFPDGNSFLITPMEIPREMASNLPDASFAEPTRKCRADCRN